MLSLAIAIAGWAYLRLTPNPVIAAHFVQTLTVPISTTGLPGDEVARVADKQAVVVIDVPRSGVAVEPREVRAVLDLSGRGPGFYNVPLAVIAPKFSIKSLSPASVTLDVDRVETRVIPDVSQSRRRGIARLPNPLQQPRLAKLLQQAIERSRQADRRLRIGY